MVQLAEAALARASVEEDATGGDRDRGAILDRLLERELELLASIVDGRHALRLGSAHPVLPEPDLYSRMESSFYIPRHAMSVLSSSLWRQTYLSRR